MPTPAERRAILFVGAVAVLGVGWRAVGQWRDGSDVGGAQPELERQLLAAERVRDEERAAREERKGGAKAAPKGRTRRKAAAEDTGTGATGARPSPRPSVPRTPPAQVGPVDLDRADSAEIVALPGIGPALAGRILANRRAQGSFGGPEALDAVPGVGPALLARLAGHVTFSGPSRPLLGPVSDGAGASRRRRMAARP